MTKRMTYLTFKMLEDGTVEKCIITAADQHEWSKKLGSMNGVVSAAGCSKEMNPAKYARLDAMEPKAAMNLLDQDN